MSLKTLNSEPSKTSRAFQPKVQFLELVLMVGKRQLKFGTANTKLPAYAN